VAYRLALEEMTRDRVPLDWAMTQNNLRCCSHSHIGLGNRRTLNVAGISFAAFLRFPLRPRALAKNTSDLF
jgi:hypothetical protein